MTMTNRRALALMPHPDDMEILCAGTLIRLQRMGWEIHVATMTAGDKGSSTLSRRVITDIRREEARRGARAVGAVSCNCLEFADLEITFDNLTRHAVTHLLRKIDPAIVFTTPPVDYMPDHEITSQLVRDACFSASVKNYETEVSDKPTASLPHLYYTDSLGGHDLYGDPIRVSCIVDISAQMKQKAEALACHISQRDWLRKQHGMDEYIESMQSFSAARGRMIHTAFGEGFCQHRGHPFPADDLLASILEAVTITQIQNT